MTKVTPREGKEQIIAAFNQLLVEQQKIGSTVATKEEEAQKEKNRELLEQAATYTVDNIVKGMGDLQLDFGAIVQQLSDKLEAELSKLQELGAAIQVKTEQLAQLRKVRLVADTSYILEQEHQEGLKLLQGYSTEQKEIIEQEITQARKIWEKEQQDYLSKVTEETEARNKQREQEKANHDYQLQRERTIERNQYQEAQRKQEREILDYEQSANKDWAEREKYLEEHLEEYQRNQTEIAGFEERLKQEYNQVKGEAIKEAEREAKVKTDLFEKEWEATKLGYEFRIQSLDTSITKQAEQIAELMAQLQASTTQAQNLAMRAFPVEAAK